MITRIKLSSCIIVHDKNHPNACPWLLFDILQVALLKVVFFGRFPASDKGGMNLSNGLPSNWKTLSWK